MCKLFSSHEDYFCPVSAFACTTLLSDKQKETEDSKKRNKRCRTEKTDGREDGTSETEGTTEILDTGTRENAIEETEGIEIGRETEQEEGKMKGIIIQTAVKSENVQRKGQSAERKRNQENR